MSLLNHPCYKEESEKFQFTKAYLKKYDEELTTKKIKTELAVEQGTKHFNSDNSQNYIDLIINTTLMDNLSQKLKNLKKSHVKPYFARVDFTEEDNNHIIEKLYIGKLSLLNEKTDKFIIVDWRAPVSNLYYEGRIGKGSYSCLEGEVKGDISLKRQYTIENGALKDFFDIDITTNDDFLQASLSGNKDNRLKDIVSTIQAEQNKVIRADMWKPLIVQGAAGGGKTTIALHRIAYLLYAYEKTLSPQNFMIIAPNKFFLSYISDVLPELGVENVRQTTFEDFATEIIGCRLKLTDVNTKLVGFVNRTEENTLARKISGFKASLKFKNIIDTYLHSIQLNFLPKADFEIDGYVLFKYKELQKLFLTEYKNLPLMKRINEIRKHLRNKLKLEKNDILEALEKDFDRKIDELRNTMADCTERRKLITETIDLRDTLISKIKKHSQSLVRDYINKITPLSSLNYYKNLISNRELFTEVSKRYLTEDAALQFINYSKNLLAEDTLENEDLAPIMYINYLIYGVNDKITVRHMIIDEAQDFSLFQLYVLKTIVNESSFTILGDLCQGIHSYRGIKDWKDVVTNIFEEDNCDYLTLKQSYRTTIEIMDAASSVIKLLKDDNLPTAEPVIRHGEEVKVVKKTSLEAIALSITEKIDSLMVEDYKSFAIITKTLEEAIILKELLKKLKLKTSLITGKEKDYVGGVVIVPSYLVKGLEFDVVIIANASKEVYTEDPLDVKLLYVAMTRPLHKLYIYSLGQAPEML